MKARIQRLVERAQATLPARVLMAYGQSQASNFALALAFAGFMSMFPIMLGSLSLIGYAVRDPGTYQHFQTLILQLFPSTAHDQLLQGLSSVKQSAGWFALISFAGILWSASSIFSTMEFALTEIFGTKQRDMLRQRAMGLVMILVLVAGLVLTVLINSVVAFVPLPFISTIVGFVGGAVVMIGLLCALYRFVPNRTFSLREVLPGAILAGAGIELLSLGWSVYAGLSHNFNTYGATFGLFFLLATWFYLLSQLVLLGAVYNKFRLGQPQEEGLVASPMHQSREKASPSDKIEQKKAEATPPAPPRRSIFQRAALGSVLALAIAAGVFGRRRRRPAA